MHAEMLFDASGLEPVDAIWFRVLGLGLGFRV